ncbi:PP2C family protein-serine/threonine phosphatase [Pantoea stewartii]|uniref:PP2C family protein-serine/threonine phosphatase n=1 Tax=Pantoea stewartii TaxID=66269 RepID=UPI0013903FFF|nr:protein phosphatase 2C domain-containing protein [Pantoea stewartii]
MIKIINSSSFSYPKEWGSENQDTILPYKKLDNGYIIAVADGVGGYDLGYEASSLAISEVNNIDNSLASFNVHDFFISLHEKMKAKSKIDPNFFESATTLTFCLLSKKILTVGHCGDSRLYIYDNCKLKQVTKDQTQHQILVDKGLYSRKQLRKLQGGNVLTSALSAKLPLVYQTYEIPLDDILQNDNTISIFIMSDGAHFHWEDRPRFSLKTMQNPAAFATSLKKRIIKKGAHDDYSFVGIKAFLKASS